MITQNERILNHLRHHGSITQLDAIQEYGCTRLSARIYDIRNMGHEVSGEFVKVKNRYGDDCTIKMYRLGA